jgi:hypothetical protein
MALDSTQPLTEMSTLPPSMSRMSKNVGASTYQNPKDLQGLYSGDSFTVL